MWVEKFKSPIVTRTKRGWTKRQGTDGRLCCAEPEFLKILKCNSAETASAGIWFNYVYILMVKH
jgi:hypothetical protein